jgi:hypothetical protein
MYIVIGTRPDGRQARLEYDTLDEAMQKVRDLIEADELDAPVNGPMFVRYAIELDPPLRMDGEEEHVEDEDDGDGGPLIFRPAFRDDDDVSRN